ncbi:hypothetical protein GCM10022631_11820 [Deinococcus rubellus]|uniref:Uncharacterized protein n=1 Tax=Deinococcus rubellus TaxID=1889240 RepID=A0ABY5YFA1_9DEIO|nr:hypothetical protein [Deinococcus rubellus]UWX62772.1 hypothetical protein N0D28_08295 [Deinococcus rubellus]
MNPSIGRIVHYVLSAQDADQINRRRTTGPSIAERIKDEQWPLGAQAHIGNRAEEGQHVAAIVVNVFGPATCNLQCFLDGNDVFWATSQLEGSAPSTWHRPERE